VRTLTRCWLHALTRVRVLNDDTTDRQSRVREYGTRGVSLAARVPFDGAQFLMSPATSQGGEHGRHV
jgi:hypothetical protein